MASVSETGFGAKIRKAQDLLLAINSFPVYDPPRDEESIAEMTVLVDQIIQLNNDETIFRENYREAANDRRNAFHEQPGSVMKLLSPLNNAVTAQYGRESKYAGFVKELARKLRATKAAKSEVNGTKTVSTSEHSFGAMTKTFNDLVLLLMQFPDYDPSNPDISIPVLQQKVQDITALNDAVTQKALLLKSTKEERAAKYTILQERIARIKAYIRAHYGIHSSQYDAIRTMRM